MTISRAAWDAIAAFVDSLPEYVPAPEVANFPFARWADDGFHISLDPGGDKEYCRKRLIEHYGPKPRSYEVLVHSPSGTGHLEAGNCCTAWLDTPKNRDRLDDMMGEWQPFTLVERTND